MVSVAEFIAVVEVHSLSAERAVHTREAASRASARGEILLLLDDASPQAFGRLLDRIVPACAGRVRSVRCAILVRAPATATSGAPVDDSEPGAPLPLEAALLDRVREVGIPRLRLQGVAEAFRFGR